MPGFGKRLRRIFINRERRDADAPRTNPGEPYLCRMERNLRVNIRHGVFNIAALDMVNPFTGIFAMKLGASAFEVALLSSAPAAVSLVAMIPGAYLIDRSDRKKRLTFLFMLAHRVFYLALVCVPFFAPSRRTIIFVALIAAMNFPGAISNVAWQSFISKVIPPERRAEAFAARNKIMNVVGTVVTLLVGLALDRMAFPLGYQVVFGIAFVMALIELKIFNELDESVILDEPPVWDEPSLTGKGPGAPRQSLAAIFREKRFIRYTLASIIFYFGWQIAWPLFNWYQVKELGANNVWVSILNLMNTGGSLFGYGFWVRMSNKHGHLRTLFYSSSGIFIVPVIYAFSHSLYTIGIFNFLIGAIFSGVNLTLFNALLEVTPENRKASYIAYYNTLITISGVIAPIAGVSLLKMMNFQWAFITCAILRILGSLGFLVINRMEAREGVNTF